MIYAITDGTIPGVGESGGTFTPGKGAAKPLRFSSNSGNALEPIHASARVDVYNATDQEIADGALVVLGHVNGRLAVILVSECDDLS